MADAELRYINAPDIERFNPLQFFDIDSNNILHVKHIILKYASLLWSHIKQQNILQPAVNISSSYTYENI